MDIHDVIILEPRDKNLKAPNYNDFDKICRICLKRTSDQRTVHEVENKLCIKTLLEVYAYLQIPSQSSNDPLPQLICPECIDFLIEIHTFRSRCRVNDDLLRKVLHKATNAEGNDVSKPPQFTIPNYYGEDNSGAIIEQINEERMGIFRCKSCEFTCDDRKTLLQHLTEAKHSRSRSSACPHCGRMFNTTALKLHIRTHTKERPFVCTICHAAFTVKGNLQRHMLTHDNKREFICEYCGKAYLRQETLQEHLVTHTLEKAADKVDDSDGMMKKFVCQHCGQRFLVQRQLSAHLLRHKNRFLCNMCGRKFGSKNNLITHMRTHTGERPFQCEECEKAFTQKSALRTHMTIHSGNKPFQCDSCEKRFAAKSNLISHMRLHTGDTPHWCNECDRGFSTSSTLRKHKQLHGKGESRNPEKLQTGTIEEESIEEEVIEEEVWETMEVPAEHCENENEDIHEDINNVNEKHAVDAVFEESVIAQESVESVEDSSSGAEKIVRFGTKQYKIRLVS